MFPFYGPQTKNFGTSKNMLVRPFVSTFHTPKYSIWAKNDEKCLQKVLPTYFRLSKIFVWGPYIFEKFIPPKRRFWKVGRWFQNAFAKYFSRMRVPDLGHETLKTRSLKGWFRRKRLACIFEALFEDVSTRIGPRNVEKCFENARQSLGFHGSQTKILTL